MLINVVCHFHFYFVKSIRRNFKNNRPTKIFIHGWKSSPETFESTKDIIFKSKIPANIFLVDWTAISDLKYCEVNFIKVTFVLLSIA